MPGDRIPHSAIAPCGDGHHTQRKRVMELSYAQLNLMEEALRQYFDNKATDWVCSYDEQVSLTRNEIISFVEEIIAEQECVYG